MRFQVFVLLGFISFSLPAQISPNIEYGTETTRDILRAEFPERGIYQNFQELRQNNPSDQAEFREESRSGRVVNYTIRDAQTNKKIKKVYGFSDGQSVYINTYTYRGQGNYYVKIETIGRYLFFRDEDNGEGTSIGGAIAIGPVAIGRGSGYRIRAYVLDIQNGVIENVNKKTMKAILAKDRDLLRAYEAESQKTDPEVIKKYIEAYNEKHPVL